MQKTNHRTATIAAIAILMPLTVATENRWTDFRQLTTTFGQCYGVPAALPDGTVVVVHSTPYGPGSRGSRAMISRDEGRTWQDETYYLTFSEPSGYNHSLALTDGTILTVAARNDTEPLTAIRWRPVKGTRP